MKNMKILITGSNGFIAKNLINHLKKEYDIIGIGRTLHEIQDSMYIQADIGKREELFGKVLNKVTSVDILIHVAAEISENVERLYQTNCCGTQNVVDLAKKLCCKRVVYVSSIPVVGTPIEFPITEEHRVSPNTVYHYTKYFGEQIVTQLKGEGILYGCLRIASPVGAGMPQNKIFSVFVENAKNGKDIVIYGNGERIQNYIDVRDFSEAVSKIIHSSAQGVYNISGNSISDLELARQCKKCFETTGEIFIDEKIQQSAPEKWIISGKAALRDFGYTPKKSIVDSIRYVAKGLK